MYAIDQSCLQAGVNIILNLILGNDRVLPKDNKYIVVRFGDVFMPDFTAPRTSGLYLNDDRVILS
jgi:hypothetical protein